jgi:signal transduction histidine kinase
LLPFVKSLRQALEFYQSNRFDDLHDSLLKAFVETIHDDHSLQRFFQVCVTVPLLIGKLKSGFYLFDESGKQFLCVCESENGLLDPPRPVDLSLELTPGSVFILGDQLFHPLYPRHGSSENKHEQDRPGRTTLVPDPYFSHNSLLGLYAVGPVHALSDADRALFGILTRWMGNKLNNRLIADRHLEHLQFLNALGRDIGHNIIVPNMYLKHLLRQMEKQIDELDQAIVQAENEYDSNQTTGQYFEFPARCRSKQEALRRSHRELLKHHNQITLFLESLLREQHFSQGHLVLQPTSSFVERDIILPQLDLYKKKLQQQGITVDKPQNMYEQKFPLMVDVGLLSQVYANLFSNAVKYTDEIIDHQGRPRKALAYGVEEVPDFPVPGRKGIKFNVFTTGRPLSDEERLHIFEEGARADNSRGIAGSGHGLNFIQRVIEVHGGKVGCEASEEGNNFYFILPISPENDTPDEHHDTKR